MGFAGDLHAFGSDGGDFKMGDMLGSLLLQKE